MPKKVLMSTSYYRFEPTSGHPGQVPWTRGNRLVGWDPARRRMWVGGQRLHHGATGMALAAAGLLRLSHTRRLPHHRGLGWTLAGSMLVAHDWKDRSVWFRRGSQDV
jgi:hypothetical protein